MPKLSSRNSEKINSLNRITKGRCSPASNTPFYRVTTKNAACEMCTFYCTVYGEAQGKKSFLTRKMTLLNGQTNTISKFLLVSFFCLVWGDLEYSVGGRISDGKNCFNKIRGGFLQKFQSLTL